MKNPLNKRLFRELRADIGKYMVIFIVMVIIIGEGSGFLVAANGLLKAYNDSFGKYNVEDGNFSVSEKLSKSTINSIENNEKVNIKIYENFYVEGDSYKGSTLRLFKVRKDINRASILSGRLPKEDNEVAIDRMYADNNRISLQDEIPYEGKKYKVTGLIALSDYSTLFQSNSDVMFDATLFGVGVVTESAFESYSEDDYNYSYSWKYKKKPHNKDEETKMSEKLMKQMASMVKIETYTPQYANQAIMFTGEDFGSDSIMIRVFVYMIIVILAFVFGIMMSNTIQNESENIGTLRASGYTINEIITHYMLTPVFVTLVSALIGNIFGYTVMEKVNADLYYGSYSLPKYETLFNFEAFVETTVVPVLLMIIISYCTLRNKLKLSPLRFLRHDLGKKGRKRAFYLSRKIPFFLRFRIRVIFQNISNYLVLIFGLFFANFLLVFGLLFPQIIKDYSANVEKNMFSKYQYMLQVPIDMFDESSKLKSTIAALKYKNGVETETKGAEKFTSYGLISTTEGIRQEDVSFYGISQESEYLPLKLKEDDFVISKSFAEKFMLKVGDKVKLKEEFENKYYSFKVTGIYDYYGSICAFMNQKALNEKFDLGDDYFSGYFSNEEIKDIDKKYLGSVVDIDSMTKASRQLEKSMGSVMDVVAIFSVIIFVVLIYLLSKIIIEKNASNISMSKILGYMDREISNLYINATTIVVIIGAVGTTFICSGLIIGVFHAMLRTEMNGWFDIKVPPIVIIKMLSAGIISYGVIAFFEYIKIKRIPLEEALKNDE